MARISSVTPSCSQSPARPSRSSGTTPRMSYNSMPSRLATALLALSMAAYAPQTAYAQNMNNVTSLTGTWSTGYGSVMTGPGFASPTNFTFKYPNTTGMSYSFTDDGYFEEAQYRFVSNGSEPHCVQAVIIWQHGSYIINSNNSITLNPIESDGRIQVQDPCAAESNVITYYSQQTLFSGWSIIADPNHSRYMLQLLRFDGALEPRMYLYYRPPNMLPTSQLWTSDAYKSYVAAHGGSSAATRTQAISLAGIVAGALGALTWAIFA